MTDYTWSDTRRQIIRAFGDELPHAEAEQAVIDVFTRQPTLVLEQFPIVADAKRNGRARSGWAVLKSRLQPTGHNITASDQPDRETALRKTKAWIERTGLMYDREDELLDEAIERGVGGMPNPLRLKPWDTPELRAELVAHWQAARPRGEQLDQEELDRAERWKQTHKAAGRLP